MKIRKIAHKLHCWLGMLSGIIVFIICLTGAIWALKINGWIDSDPEYSVAKIQQPKKQPSELAKITSDRLGWQPTYITYYRNNSVRIGAYGKGIRSSAVVNSFTGEILWENSGSDPGEFDFWHFIRRGHRSLWLPFHIGRPIVNYSTLVFVLVLISGMVRWFPKTKKALRKRVRFNWKSRTPLKRRLVDMHGIFGFYMFFFLLVISFTGMVWGIEWWSKGLYGMTTGGKTLPAWGAGRSDTTAMNSMDTYTAVDILFKRIAEENPEAESIGINFPDTKDAASVVNVTVNPVAGVYYNSDRYTFDRYSLKELGIQDVYNGKYAGLKWGDKLRRMNYDIHIGAVAGVPGRIIVFLAALFGASLPCTGLYIFIIKRKKRKGRAEF